MIYRPNWIKAYSDVGFPKDWADDVVRKYDQDFVSETTENYSPVRLADDSLGSVLEEVDDSGKFTKTESIAFLLDLLIEFSEHIPEDDKDIYGIYEKIQYNDRLSVQVEFPEFYAFCRKVQYSNVENIPEYRTVNKAIEKYTFKEKPDSESVWEIKYKDTPCKVEIIGEVPMISEDIIDPPLYCRILDVKQQMTDSEVAEDEFVQIPAENFDNGRCLTKS